MNKKDVNKDVKIFEKYPHSKNGICIPLSKEENKKLYKNLKKFSMADLLAFNDYCLSKQDYFQRRFLKNVKKGDPNWPIQESMYSWWLWWFHMTEYVKSIINNKIDSLFK